MMVFDSVLSEDFSHYLAESNFNFWLGHYHGYCEFWGMFPWLSWQCYIFIPFNV